jgi:SAM-dependent methyltransferase
MAAIDGYEKAAHLYDLFDSKPNIDFFVHYAIEAGEILDIGAGTGRIAIPIAEAGLRVICIEPSAAMRREFEKRLDQKPQLKGKITLIDGDAASFSLARPYPSAFMSGSFEHLLDDDERRQGLLNIWQHLSPGGKLVFDTFVGPMGDSPLKPAGELTLGDTTYRRQISRHVLPDGKTEMLLVYEALKGGKQVEHIEQRSIASFTDRANIHRLLAEAGFTITREFSAYDFTSYQEGAPDLILEATK